MNHISKI